jgi:hypothetical protein
LTRHICVEAGARSEAGTGTPLRDFLKLIGADTRAKYVWFQCADKDGYNSPLDMATALHAQTQMTFKFGDEILPRAYGFPMKIRVPTKLGFKNPKYVMSMEVTNDYKGGFWEDQGIIRSAGVFSIRGIRRDGHARKRWQASLRGSAANSQHEQHAPAEHRGVVADGPNLGPDDWPNGRGEDGHKGRLDPERRAGRQQDEQGRLVRAGFASTSHALSCPRCFGGRHGLPRRHS